MAAAAAACRRALLLARCNPSSSRAVAGLASGLGAALVARGSSACSSSPIGGHGCYQGRIGHLRHASSGLGAALVARGSSACSSSPIGSHGCYQGRIGHLRHASQLLLKSNGKRAFLVDTLALVRSLEAQGIPSKHAEAITSAITEVLNDSLENVAQSFVSQGELQKEHHFSMLQRETEKLRSDIEKLRSELRYEIDKVTAGQRLDLNLERGHTRDQLAKQNAETSELTNKLDREIHALRALLEAAKYEVIKYCIGSLVSITAVGLAVVRILL